MQETEITFIKKLEVQNKFFPGPSIKTYKSPVVCPTLLSLPDKNDVQSTLLRLSPPLMITPEIEQQDRFNFLQKEKKEKEERAVKLETKLKAKFFPLVHNRQGTIIPNICLDTPEKLKTQTVLETIHPPVDWKNYGKKWRQKISDSCTTRTDVIALKEELDKRTKEFGLEEMGLKKRHQFYNECFDEIIRQVTINCVERGQLLLSIRDELNVTFGAYESLFSSATAFGIRKQLKRQEKMEEWREKIHIVQQEIENIEAIHEEFAPTIQEFETKFNAKMETDQKEYDEEYERLLKNNHGLKQLLLTCVRNNFGSSETTVPVPQTPSALKLSFGQS